MARKTTSQPSSRRPLLEVRNLKTQFFTAEGVVRAVDGISFNVYPGEILGLVGESGAGKSVAVRSIMRLIEEPGAIVGGEIRFKGDLLVGFEEENTTQPPKREAVLTKEEMRRRIRGREIAIIFQDPMESLNPVYSVGSQLQEIIALNRDVDEPTAREIAVEMLGEVGIPEPDQRFSAYPHQFSGGMRQRVLIAMALACEPSLIIADEPTTALDVTVQAQILRLVTDIQQRYDTSFIWVTHDMGVIAEICDRVNVMYLGEIVEQATVDDLFHDTKHPYTESLLGALPRPDTAVDELTPIEGVMPEAIDPPDGCRFYPRCPDAREVCANRRTEVREDPDRQGAPHRTACFKNDAFDVGYWESEPIDEERTAQGFDAGPVGGERR